MTAYTENAPVAAFEDAPRGLYGIQGHPEVHHSEHGAQMLENFLYDVCGAKADVDDGGLPRRDRRAPRETR